MKSSDQRKMTPDIVTLSLHMGAAFKTQNYDAFAFTWRVCEYVMNMKSTNFCVHEGPRRMGPKNQRIPHKCSRNWGKVADRKSQMFGLTIGKEKTEW